MENALVVVYIKKMLLYCLIGVGLVVPPATMVFLFSPAQKQTLPTTPVAQPTVTPTEPTVTHETNVPTKELPTPSTIPLMEQFPTPQIGMTHEFIPQQQPLLDPNLTQPAMTKLENKEELPPQEEAPETFSEFELMQPVLGDKIPYSSPLTGKSSSWKNAPPAENNNPQPIQPKKEKQSTADPADSNATTFGNTFDGYSTGGRSFGGFGHGGAYNPFGGGSYAGGSSSSYGGGFSGGMGGGGSGAREGGSSTGSSGAKKPSVSCSVGDSASPFANALNNGKDAANGGLPFLPQQPANNQNEQLMKALLEQQQQQHPQNQGMGPQQPPSSDPLTNEMSKLEEQLEKKIFDGSYDEKKAEESLNKIGKKIEEDIKKVTAGKSRLEAQEIKKAKAVQYEETFVEPVIQRLTEENKLVKEDTDVAQKNQELTETEQVLMPLMQQAQQDPNFQANPQKMMALQQSYLKRNSLLEERKERVTQVLQKKDPRNPALNYIKKANGLIEKSTGKKTQAPHPTPRPTQDKKNDNGGGILDHVGKTVSDVASSTLGAAQQFAAQNPDLIKTGLGVAGTLAPALLPVGLGYAGSVASGALSLAGSGFKGIGALGGLALTNPVVPVGIGGTVLATKIAYDLYTGNNYFRNNSLLKNKYLAHGFDIASSATKKTVDGAVEGAKLANDYLIQPGLKEAKKAASWTRDNVLKPSLNLLGFGQ